MKQKQHLGVSTHPRVCGFASKNIYKKIPAVLEASTSEHMCHLPNKMHLQACIEGARVQRNRKKYTRKGKDRFDARKFEY